MTSDGVDRGIEVVVDTLLLIGSDHITDVRKYVRSKLRSYKPDFISLEHEINLGLSGEVLPGPKNVKRKRFGRNMSLYLYGQELVWFEYEQRAGMDYALDRKVPLYFIDRIQHLDRDAIFGLDGNDFVRLEVPCDEELPTYITGRNIFVKNAYDILVPMYRPKTAAHICGTDHLDERKGIPLQKLIKARRYVVINAVTQEEKIILGTDLKQ